MSMFGVALFLTPGGPLPDLPQLKSLTISYARFGLESRDIAFLMQTVRGKRERPTARRSGDDHRTKRSDCCGISNRYCAGLLITNR